MKGKQLSEATEFTIAFERAVLEDMVKRYGLEDERVLEQSQKLDALIVEEQRRRVSNGGN